MVGNFEFPHIPALVSRAQAKAKAPIDYLVATGAEPRWTLDPTQATSFCSMKEAMRAALRLPGEIRAFSLPLESELTLKQSLH